MNTSEDEPSSGLNGRLRPRKSTIPSPLSIKQIVHKFDGKQTQEKLKRSSTPSKASPSKSEDLSNNSALLLTPQLLCPYCDRKFGSKQNVSKHIRRLHLSTSKIESSIVCLFCNHVETEPSDIIRHMIDNHPNQYFACLDCHTRFPSTKELAEHKLNICEKQKLPYRSKLRRKTTKKSQKALDSQDKDDYSSQNFGHGFNGIVISCELKPARIHDEADIEDNITTNLILPPNKNISTSAVLEKNAVIVLDDIQWNRRIPSNFSFHNTDADQILSRLGVVHRSPKTGESTKKDWFRAIEDATQKFEKCFDTSFYSKVASNVQENLTKFLDGSFNFNPDPDSTIKTRKSKNSVVINTAEGFPILLACEQYSRNTYDGYIPRTIAPKHKWKWDSLENEKPWNPDQIKRDTHANNCIITLVSSLDIWTQLRMRRKFEDKFNITPVEKKTEKQNVICKQLKEILESREIPTSNSQIVKYLNTPLSIPIEQDFPTTLGLMPSAPKFNVKPAILSGEWVRPRCYVCCACGAQSRDSRALSMHVSSKHPNAQVQHYEIVGESLLKADILKHLYVPPCHNMNRTRPPRGFRDCTKCTKSIAIEDLHQHMLDCAGDTPTVRRKCRYRPFGVRKRRPRLPDNRIRKKIRNDIRTRPSRQKSRLRPKPKNRSEVGDAETIRKMLADLPAKRHRVLVNPLNSILRPRRKLDKQRAMLMMKRHTSEDLKSSKPKPSNTVMHYDLEQTSTNIDRYKSVPKRDDEDNEPLKPRLKRVACNITRQKESLNRKAMLKKPKRKIRLVMEKKENDSLENEPDTSVSCPVKIHGNELSLDHNEKRIDVNENPQDVREHSSGRGDSNNDQRDNQRPGGSGLNDNSRNVCAPAQNVPLKHSIARLTANSETHDKSVQFHHLFLVQQECNNTNEHVPTGQRVLFENEAVVTKLDKPPLHFHQNIPLESVQEHNTDPIQENNLESIQNQTFDSMQKNKLNKPRKGLNDCIAMLKNKLVDTDPNTPGHVSVQCGTDDLLSPDTVLIRTSTLISPKADVVMKSVQANPSTEQPKKPLPKTFVRNEQLPKPSPLYRGQYFNHNMYGPHINNERQTTQWRPVNYEAIMPRYVDNRARKETSRRRSTSQHENIFYAQQLLSVTPPNDDMLIKLPSETYNPYSLPIRNSPKNFQEQCNVESHTILNRFGKRKAFDQNPSEVSQGLLQNCGFILNNPTEKDRKSVDSCKKITRTRVSTPRKSVESLEKNQNLREEVPKNLKDNSEKYRKKSLDCQPQRDLTAINTREKRIENYSQVTSRSRSSNVNTEVTLSQYKSVELQLKTDLNAKLPRNVYPEQNLNNNQVSIPLAHASTNVESILSVPLDLSSKALPVDPDYSSRHDETLTNYDRCETLDLSNKRRINMEHHNQDEVVDLRIKHSSEYPGLTVLKPHCSASSQHDPSTVTALNLVRRNDCLPTDLSLKRKDKDKCLNLCQSINTTFQESHIQDLSKNKTKPISNVDSLLPVDDLPTDLSNKRVVNIENTAMTVRECNQNNVNVAPYNYHDANEQEGPSDLSIKVNKKILHDYTTKSLIGDNHVTTAQTTEIHEKVVVSETSNTQIILSQTQKPVYDPTLRIPQYKIRPTETESFSRDPIVTVSPLTAITTCAGSYFPNQISINTAVTTCVGSYLPNQILTNMPVTICAGSYLPNQVSTNMTNTTCSGSFVSNQISINMPVSTCTGNYVSNQISTNAVVTTCAGSYVTNQISTNTAVTTCAGSYSSNPISTDMAVATGVGTYLSNQISANTAVTTRALGYLSTQISTTSAVTTCAESYVSNQIMPTTAVAIFAGNYVSNQISTTTAVTTFAGSYVSNQISTNTDAITRAGSYMANQISTNTAVTTCAGIYMANQISTNTAVTPCAGSYMANQISTNTAVTTCVGSYMANQVSTNTTVTTCAGSYLSNQISTNTVVTTFPRNYVPNQISTNTAVTTFDGSYVSNQILTNTTVTTCGGSCLPNQFLTTTAVTTLGESYVSKEISINSIASTCPSTSTVTNISVVASIEAQERMTYSFTKSTLHSVVTSVTGSLSVYSLFNRGITTPMTTFESTRPVYALPNCISTSKIDSTTNNLLSIPSTTIISTSPVYTLAGTTVVTPSNCVTLPSTGQSIPLPPPRRAYLSEVDSQIMTHYTSTSKVKKHERRYIDTNILIRGAMLSFERGYGLSRQLVILPKDIMAILKIMPIYRRNQLLYVLSQYLSASPARPMLSTHKMLFENAIPNILKRPIRFSRELAVETSTGKIKIKPTYTLQLPQTANRRRTSLYPLTQRKYPVLSNEIIDLTYDEIVPKIDIDNEVNDEQEILSIEEIPVSIAPTSYIPKSNSEKTASLRAVRIKAPSERQQLKILANSLGSSSCPAISSVRSNDNYNNDQHKFLHADIPNIQMYEVSSTQSNKYKVSDIELSYNTHQRVCSIVVKSKTDMILKENNEPPLKRKAIGKNSSDNIVTSNETTDFPRVSDYINLHNDSNIDSSVEHRLNETDGYTKTISEPEINQTAVKHNLNRQEVDYDSDDDVSLAVIVKQKQQKENKLKLSPLNTEVKSDRKSIDKNKLTNTLHNQQIKHTNEIIPVDTLVRDTKGTIHNKVSAKVRVTDIYKANKNISELSLSSFSKQKEISTCTIERKSKSKKKGKKNRRDIIKKVKMHDKKEVKINEPKIVEHLERSSQFASVKESIESSLKSNAKESEIMSFETITVSYNEDINVSDDVEKSSKNLTANLKSNKNIHQQQRNIDRCDIKLKDLDVSRKVEIKSVRNVIQTAEVSLEISNGVAIHNNNEQSTVEELPNTQNRIVDVVNICGPLGDDRNNILLNNDLSKTSNDDDVTLSLRRSKRGKSLFVEGNEQALIYSDTILEQKGPLTKKQLIFSKLLLDEEKNFKISTSVDNMQTTPEEDNFSHQDKPQKSSQEKRKSLKRKKSPHSKKKSKKKKIIDDSERVVSDNDITKVFVSENSDVKIKTNALEGYIDSSPDLIHKSKEISEVTQIHTQFDTDNNNDLSSNSNEVILEQNKSQSLGTVKRKIDAAVNNYMENIIHGSKPKKVKLNDVNDMLVTLSPETETSNKNNLNSNNNLPHAARRARSKSVVVKSSGSMLYDPYDIDLEDMGDKTEPFRKQRLTSLRTGNYKLPAEHNIEPSTTIENFINIQEEMNIDDIPAATTTAKHSKETVSDSDESSKSDVPLKKYVEEKERKHQLCESTTTKFLSDNTNDDRFSNDIEMKQSRKKNKKNKRSVPVIADVQKEDKDDKELSEEQLRSEQFMESFGFFSERKPRKSNLLATKKISETFHIIANESDDMYLDTKERSSKKSSRGENKRVVEEDDNAKHCKPLLKEPDAQKLSTKSDKNLKLRSATLYCHLCKKEFRRTDNLVRHQMTLLHASKLSESAMKLRPAPAPEDFNYLVVFKQHLERLKMLEQKMKNKKQSKKFTLPSLHQMYLDVRKSVREQQLARLNLSRDQALFLDCCELLKDSNRGHTEDRNITRPFFSCCANSYALACTSPNEYDPKSGLSLEFSRYIKCPPNKANLAKRPIIHTSARLSGMADFVPLASSSKQDNSCDLYLQPSTSKTGLVQNANKFTETAKTGIIDEIADDKDDSKSEGDVDSITAQNILESEEVRNLENDLISGLKEAACKFQPLPSADNASFTKVDDNHSQDHTNTSANKETNTSKTKNPPETKEKKNLDITENIDIFEDKFDKIKRKCRSQAAAAKLVQTSVEPSTSHKTRKKSEKKKGKKNSKKYNQNTVLTKGALKGYDSIKVSILTSEIDMSAIVPPIVTSSKKKKKRSSKKKRDRKNSILNRKLDTNGSKESSSKNIDVYEFLDNEEPEIFELRPSTVMERFRNLNKKEMQSSKITPNRDEVVSTGSVSDGDDFVYMSDDYVCSDDETENSIMSCELGAVKGSNELKKSFSPLKRKDVMEKNAVMGKIFKHNAVRSEKKIIKPKETTKPKANLDQLFDSLLEDEPNSSALMNDTESPKRDSCISQKKRVFSPIVLSKYDLKTNKNSDHSSKKLRTPSPALSSDSVVSRRISSSSSRQSSPRRLSSRFDVPSPIDYEPSTSKRCDDSKKYDRFSKDYELPLTKKHDSVSEKKYDTTIPNNINIDDNLAFPAKGDKILYNTYDKSPKDRSHSKKKEKTADYETGYDFKADYYDDDAFSDDAGVARQRARRKCTVGKQNVLAETWSSESELDGVPPRPNSAESVVLNVARKRKGRKREGQISGGRKTNKHVSVKKQDFESRVTSSNRNPGTSSGVGAGTSRSSGGSSAYTQQLSLPGPSGIGPRLRPTTSFWADGDEEPEHVQQHGWIVGDSHKKLVTMLAHAKGRKRNNDDKVRLME